MRGFLTPTGTLRSAVTVPGQREGTEDTAVAPCTAIIQDYCALCLPAPTSRTPSVDRATIRLLEPTHPKFLHIGYDKQPSIVGVTDACLSSLGLAVCFMVRQEVFISLV
jgi:hypothetical protein